MEQSEDRLNLNEQLNKHERTNQFSNSSKPTQNYNSKLCSFYSNFGFCKFGQNCKFLHQRKNISKASSQNKTGSLRINSLEFNQKKEKYTDATNSRTFYSIGATDKNIQKASCRFYKAGQCKKGENCLFNHNLDSHNFQIDRTVPNNSKNPITKNRTSANKKSVPICHYFKRGFCQKGEQCKYYHNPRYQKELYNKSNINKNNLSDYQALDSENAGEQNLAENSPVISSHFATVNSNNTKSIGHSSNVLIKHEISQELKQLNANANDATANNFVQIRIQIPQNSRVFNLDTVSENGLFQLRCTEINQLKKRFPKLKEENSTFMFDFEPTDPDWPFDIRSLHLQVTFPESYPLEVCDITVVSYMNFIPGVLLRHLNKSISDWLIEKHIAAVEQNQVVLLFRPFLKWFDKNLGELFKLGFKKVTEDEDSKNTEKESIPPKNSSALLCDDTPENDLSEEECSVSSNIPSMQEDLEEKEQTHSPPKQDFQTTDPNNSQMPGSKIIFIGLELIEGIATMTCKKLAIGVQCNRCKTSCNKILIPNKNMSMLCSKCSRNMECNFNPSILHQFSSVLGTIYLMDCLAVDVNLVECAFIIDCLSCEKQAPADGLHYGQKQKLWCKFCNQKLILGIEGVKFQTSAATATSSDKTVAAKKIVKKKDPVIKEGCPLPEYGACKHYKKSYRWLRFPCCGRLYPCDLCHDEKEDDHDMKYASRMVCGFCSKEQPYSKEKPCFGCSANMTKKSGSYWEGGQGCRNSVLMSRKDAHKFAGMSKTISKKSQPSGKKKK